MQKIKQTIILASLAGISLVESCFAQALVTQIKPNGTAAEITLSESNLQTKQYEYIYKSQGNMSVPASILVEAPTGTKLQVQAALVTGNVGDLAAASSKAKWFPLDLTTPSGRSRKVVSIKTADTSALTGGDLGGMTICDLLSPKDLRDFLATLTAVYGRPVTREEICSPEDPGTNPSDPNNPNNQGYSQITTIIRKNTCLPEKRANYLVRVLLDLTPADPAAIVPGALISMSVTENKFRGNRAASLKPESDGKFAPRPLLLMSSLGGFYPGGESLTQITWNKNGTPRSTKKMRVEDYVFYKGLVLARAVMGGLNGGQASFELSNGSNAYSICLKLQRRRQKVNGYP